MLTGLSGLTTYYVRAYATNSAGTAYGDDISFTTLVSVREWYVPGDYVAASYPGSGLADWSPDKSPMVKSIEANPNNVEGYVYMANASNSWKFASKPNWDGPNYGAGAAPGTLDPAGDNINLPAGYYKINVNAGADPMTYTAVATSWGIIGGLTSWSSQIALTYDPAVRVWKGGVHMTAGEWKFRANDDWGYNLGGSLTGLTDGGDNIAVTEAGSYTITLNPWTRVATLTKN